MKKKLIGFALALCLLMSILPGAASAGSVYFTAVNSTLLDLTNETMPLVSGGVIYLPYKVFSHLGVNGIPSTGEKILHLYRGGSAGRSIDFYVSTGKTVGQDNHAYDDVAAQIINGTFYVPLDFVCTYFNLSYYIIDYELAPIIRIINTATGSVLKDNSFISYWKKDMQSFYDALTGADTSPPPEESQTPDTFEPRSYENVTIYLSFRDLSAGYTVDALNALSPGYRSCFFVSGEDILQNPGLVRRIAGNSHTIGIWLTEGTYDEYLDTAELLFEAVKLKTVIVSSDNSETAAEMALEYGLAFWPASRKYGEKSTADAVASELPIVNGSRQNLMFSCTENIAPLLSGLLSALRQGGYSVARITETASPVE